MAQNFRIGLILDTETQDPHSLPKFENFHFFENIWSGGYDSSIFRNYMYYIVFLEKYDFSPKSGKKPKFSFLPFFSKMIFLNICHRISAKKIHFCHFGQVSGGRWHIWPPCVSANFTTVAHFRHLPTSALYPSVKILRSS